jgi:hypothetical protein
LFYFVLFCFVLFCFVLFYGAYTNALVDPVSFSCCMVNKEGGREGGREGDNEGNGDVNFLMKREHVLHSLQQSHLINLRKTFLQRMDRLRKLQEQMQPPINTTALCSQLDDNSSNNNYTRNNDGDEKNIQAQIPVTTAANDLVRDSGGGGGVSRNLSVVPSENIFYHPSCVSVRGFADSVSQDDLKKLFQVFGEIEFVKVNRDFATGYQSSPSVFLCLYQLFLCH